MMPRMQRASILRGLVKLGLVLLILTGCASSNKDDSDTDAPFSRVTLQVAPIDQEGVNSLRSLASPSQTRQVRPAPAVLQIDVTAGDISPITASCPIPRPPAPGATSLCDAIGTAEATLLVTDVTETAVMVASTLLVPTGNQRRVTISVLDTSETVIFRGATTADLPDTQSTFSLLIDLNGAPLPIAPPMVTAMDIAGTSQVDPNDFETGQTHVFAITSPPTSGTATINTNGVLTYAPDPGFVGNDRVTVSVTDDGTPALSNEVPIDLTVVDLSDQAFTFADSAIFGVAGESTLSFGTFNGTNAAPVTLQVAGSPDTATGTATIASLDIVFPQSTIPVIAPGAAFSFEMTVNGDGSLNLTNTATNTRSTSAPPTPANRAPVASSDSIASLENTVIAIDVLRNDSDPDNEALIIDALTQPTHGVVVDDGNGTVTYTPDVDFNGPDAFTYTIRDPGGLTASATVIIDVLYDDFQAPPLDRSKWQNLEFIRQVQNGKLVSSIRQFGLHDHDDAVNRLLLADQGTPVTALQAEVTVSEINNVDAFPAALLAAKFFNAFFDDTMAGKGAEGDVIGFVGIGHDGTTLVAFFGVLLCLDERCEARNPLHFDTTTFGSATLNAVHVLALEWDGKRFTFRFDGTPVLLDPLSDLSLSLPVRGDAKIPFANLQTRIFHQNPVFNQDSGMPPFHVDPERGGAIVATFDQVSLNRSPFDSFDSDTIDSTKWRNQELSRQIQNGQLVSSVRQVGMAVTTREETENELEFLNPAAIKGMQAHVTVTSVNNSGAFPAALLSGAFYNDGSGAVGEGEKGDVIASIGIGHDGSQLVVVFGVGRCDDFDCITITPLLPLDTKTFGPVVLGQSYALSLVWDGTNFIFGFADNTFSFDAAALAPVVAFPADPFKGISTRIGDLVSGGFTSPMMVGATASIDATFDNVFVLERQQTLTTIQGTVVNENGNPLAGADVTAQDGLTGVTDADGRFSIANVYAGGGHVAVGVEFDDPLSGLLYRAFSQPFLGLIGVTTVGDIDPSSRAILPLQIIRDTVILQSDPFLIPAGVDGLKFDVNFLTREFFEFGIAGGVVDDISRALLRQDGAILKTEVLGSAGTSIFLTPDPTQVFGFAAQTGFRSIVIDVSSVAGRPAPVRLSISVQDEGDDDVPSALLVDNIRFVSAGIEQSIAEIPNRDFEDTSDGFSNFTLSCRQGAASDPPLATIVADLGGVLLPPSGGKMALLSTGTPTGLMLPANRCP